MLSLYYSLLSLIPVIFYIILIYLTTPSTLKIGNVVRHFIGGIMGIGVLLSIFRIFPGIQENICLDFTLFGQDIDSIIIFSFIQIGLLEETCKFLGYKIIGVKSSPIDTMIYCGITALGFSFIENITYLLSSDIDILFARSTMAMLLHLTCGLLMGYFIAISKMNISEPTTPLNRIMIKYPKFRIFLFTIVGISTATIVHGFYDLVNFVGDTSAQPLINMIIIITFGFILNLLLSKDLIKKMKNETLKKD